MQHDLLGRLLGQVYELLILFSGGRIRYTGETDETIFGKSVPPEDMFVSKANVGELALVELSLGQRKDQLLVAWC